MSTPQPATSDDLDRIFGAREGPLRAAYAPCRVSPIGAHTDHQDGLTCGMTLDRGITLTFRPLDEGRLHLHSRDFPGEVAFSYDTIPNPSGTGGTTPEASPASCNAGATPCRAAWRASSREPCRREEISTSAALQVAVLLAIGDANDIRLRREEAMDLVVAAERHDAGVQVGLLDPAVILFGRAASLVFLDCREGRPRVHRLPQRFPPFELVLVDSGRPRDLRRSPYNERVSECAAAARFLGVTDEPARLRGASPETYRRRRKEMEPVMMRRAEHYFSECKRVKKGLAVLADADLDGFAGLMTASGESLTTFFDCGTPETRDLLEILRGESGSARCGLRRWRVRGHVAGDHPSGCRRGPGERRARRVPRALSGVRRAPADPGGGIRARCRHPLKPVAATARSPTSGTFTGWLST